MDATRSESFSVLHAAKEGFKAIGKKPLRLLGMAVAVNIPPLLYALFVNTVLLPRQFVWGGGFDGLTSINLLFKPLNMVAIIILLLSLLLLRPLWIRLCLKQCSVDSPRLDRKTYISFAVANILQMLAILLIAVIAGLFANLGRDLVQAAFMAAGLLAMFSLLLYFVFFPYLIINLNCGPVQALKESVKLCRGIFWQLFGWGAAFTLCASILNSIPLGSVLTDVLFGTTTAMVYVRRRENVG